MRCAGIAVAEGVHSIQQGNARNVNGLTSQRIADTGGGSTFYDNRIEVCRTHDPFAWSLSEGVFLEGSQ